MTTRHEPEIKPTIKMDLFIPAWHGACSCGWEGNGVLSESRARKAAQQHADDRNAAVVVHAEATTDKTPEQVIEAVRALNAGHYDLVAVAWERGTSALAIFTGEGGTAAIRYVLSGDLSTVLVCERVRRGRIR